MLNVMVSLADGFMHGCVYMESFSSVVSIYSYSIKNFHKEFMEVVANM